MEELKVIDSIEKKESEIKKLEEQKLNLLNEIRELVANNPVQILEHDLKVMANTFEVLFKLKGNYSTYERAEESLNEVYSEIQILLEEPEEDSSVNAVEEEPVEAK